MLTNLQLRSPLGVFGLGSIVLSIPLVLRLIYEETILTFCEGWQMVGFSIAHGFPLLLIVGGLGVIGVHIFLACWFGKMMSDKVRARSSSAQNVTIAIAAAVLLLLLYIPYSSWITLMLRTSGTGKDGASLLRFAVADRNLKLARLILSKGVAVDATYTGDAALNAACVGKDLRMGRFLMSRGADIHKAPECRWIPDLTGLPKPIEVPGTSIEVAP
jgi:hypothetical protein